MPRQILCSICLPIFAVIILLVTFLLILCGVSRHATNRNPFPILPCLPPPCDLPSPRRSKKEKEKEKPSLLCVTYSHWSMVKFSEACPLDRAESFSPTRLPEAIYCGGLTSASLSPFSKVLFTGFLFGLLFMRVGSYGGRSCHSRLPRPSLLTVLL